MLNTSKIEIEKFNRHNFELWKLKIKDIFVDQEQCILVKLEKTPTNMSMKE